MIISWLKKSCFLLCFLVSTVTLASVDLNQIEQIKDNINKVLSTDYEIAVYADSSVSNAASSGMVFIDKHIIHVWAGLLNELNQDAFIGVMCHEWGHEMMEHYNARVRFNITLDQLLSEGYDQDRAFKVAQKCEAEADFFSGSCMAAYSNEYSYVDPFQIIYAIFEKTDLAKEQIAKNIERIAMVEAQKYAEQVSRNEGKLLSEEEFLTLYKRIYEKISKQVLGKDPHGTLEERSYYVFEGWKQITGEYPQEKQLRLPF
ncbi:MAG: M48 family metalloprotease [Pseudomonadota bacterium]